MIFHYINDDFLKIEDIEINFILIINFYFIINS